MRIFLYVQFDITCSGLCAAYAAACRIRHGNLAGGGFGDECLFGAQSSRNSAGRGFNGYFSCITAVKLHISGAIFDSEFFCGEHIFQNHIARIAVDD